MLGKVVYWCAVLAISVGLVIALILFFESRDQSQVGASIIAVPQVAGAAGLTPS